MTYRKIEALQRAAGKAGFSVNDFSKLEKPMKEHRESPEFKALVRYAERNRSSLWKRFLRNIGF